MASRWSPPGPDERWMLRLPNWVGDAVMVLPALRALPVPVERRLGVAHPRAAGIYRASGLLGEVVPARGARAPLDVPRRIETPARAIVFTDSPSGLLLARTSGARFRLGWAGRWSSLGYTHTVERPGRSVPLWRHYLTLAEAAGADAPERPDFRIEPGPEARARAAAWLPDSGAIALAPGAAYGPAKRWPIRYFQDLAHRLRERDRPVVWIGSETDRALVGEAAGEHGALDLLGRTNLLEAVAVLGRCRTLVTNDSGALHLARAAGTRMVGLFGSSNPAWTGPAPREGAVVTLGVDCSPCYRRRCPWSGDEELKCLRRIEPEQVLAALDAVEARS